MPNELVASPVGGAMIQTESQRALAEVQATMILAKQFPRDEKVSLDRMLVAFQRPALAEAALYSYSRGGAEVTGPSIRSAEAIARAWGNLQFGIKELAQVNGESTVEAFAWDIETNVRQVKIFQVKHERHAKKGTTKLTDPRDIYEMVANQGARRLRACILGVIPGDIVEACVDEAEKTLKAKADTSPEAIKKLVTAFESFGVTAEMISKRIQRNLDTITPAQLVGMRKIYNSLKDGMSKPGDWFEIASLPEDKPKTRVEERFGFSGGASSLAAVESCEFCTPENGQHQSACPNAGA